MSGNQCRAIRACFGAVRDGSAHAGYRRLDPTAIPTSSSANAYGFHGHEVDLATGLVYMRNRWYDPQMGRFVTADPLGYVDGPSAYEFAGGDPANSSDPLGLYAEAGHYYTVFLVALRVGFEPSEAFALALGDQFPDEVETLDARKNLETTVGDALNPFRSADQAATQASLNHAALHALTGGVAVIETDRAHEDPTSAIAWIETAGVPKRLIVDGGPIRAVYPSRNQCVR